ncbi:hypothetical protein OIU74_024903 [Salix koriyanagi]|uniref:Uncharacterized protein n=1 Tax=Salix koriyanagi TaxID=2511006 RepID=A0A9Q0W8E6_9ROSI|nr:hypothetical protein OIU74_024903 [Salix koriyanagi]
MKKNSIITFYFPSTSPTAEIGFSTEGKEESKFKVENANVVDTIKTLVLRVELEGFQLQPYPALLLPFLPSLLNENGIMGFVVYYVCDFSCLKLYHQGVRLLVLPDLGPNKILVSL